MSKFIPRFQQPQAIAFAGNLAIGVQKIWPLEIEIALSRLRPLGPLFVRMRDAMVSHSMKMVYFPLPKSACTLFATFLALNSDQCGDFDPARHSIHGYRLSNPNLQLRDFRLLKSPDYFRFTVIRDPHSRLVSAYIDKLVKPVQAGQKWATGIRCGDYSFESVVESMCRMRDGQIEKHFRPQSSFIRNVSLDYIGVFDDLETTFRMFQDRFGVDIEGDVARKVRAPKRTAYSGPREDGPAYVGHYTAKQLAELDSIPPPESFYSDRLRDMVAQRYAEDLEIHRKAKSIQSA